MITIKGISKEVLIDCRRIRPNEFRNVTRHDVEMVMNIIMMNILTVLKSGSLLAIKDYFLFRPNLKKKIRNMKAMIKKGFNTNNNALIKDLQNKGHIGQL